MRLYERIPEGGGGMGDMSTDDNDDLPSDVDLAEEEENNDEDEDELETDRVTHVTRDDVISVISEANTIASTKSKKRVQFLPDGILVRVREIPPRSNKSTSSDGSASDTSTDTDDSDSDSTSDSDDPSESSTKVTSDTQFTTMPPLVWNPSSAKGSYSLSKQPGKPGLVVAAKITGIHRPISPSSTSKQPPKRIRRTPSPKSDKRPKKQTAKQGEKAAESKHSATEDAKKSKAAAAAAIKKKVPAKKDGKNSPSFHSKHSKGVGSNSSSAPSFSKPGQGGGIPKATLLAHRRINSASTAKFSPVKRSSQATACTSLTIVPLSSSNHTASTPVDISMERVDRAMQSLSMGKLYTVDGFIFPTHQVADSLHLPDLLHNGKPGEDLGEDGVDAFTVNGRRGGGSSDISPRRGGGGGGSSSSSSGSSSNGGGVEGYSGHGGGDCSYLHPQLQHHPQQQQQLSPSSANRKKRYYAWQMANGSIQNTLHNTPCIAQLWDSGLQSSMGIPAPTPSSSQAPPSQSSPPMKTLQNGQR